MIRDLGSHFDQALDETFRRPYHSFGHEVELPEHVQELACRDSHKQPSLIGSEATATPLVPTQPVFASLIRISTPRVHCTP
jgi:hypothetical protein